MLSEVQKLREAVKTAKEEAKARETSPEEREMEAEIEQLRRELSVLRLDEEEFKSTFAESECHTPKPTGDRDAGRGVRRDTVPVP